MASRDLTLVLRARDEASKVISSTFGGNVVTINKTLAGLGAVTATATGALSDAAREASAFETSMRQVNTMVGLNEEEFDALSAQVRTLSGNLGVDAVDSANALYEAISAGVPKENALTFLEVASKSAIGGATDTATAIDGLTTVLNSFKMDASEAQSVADTMFTTVNLGKTTFSELSAYMSNVAPIAAAAGIEFNEVAAAIASLTKQGTPTAQATTQIRAGIQALLKPSDDMTALWKELGFASGQAAIDVLGMEGAFAAVREATDGDIGAMTKLLGSVEAVQAVLGTTGESAAIAASDLEAMRTSAGASTAAFNEMEKSSSRFGDRVRAKMQEASIAVGEFLGPTQGVIAMLPGMSAGFSAAGTAIGFFTSKNTLATAATIAHKVASTASTAATTAMTAAQWLLNAALSANPIALVVLAIAGLVAALVWLYQNNEEARRIIDLAWEGIKTVIEYVVGKAQDAMDLFNLALDAVGTTTNNLQTTIGLAWDGIVSGIKTGVNSVIGYINSLIIAWNALELKIPGFNVEFPVDIPGIGRNLSWGGLKLETPDLPTIPYLANGTPYWRGGMAWVGERGPELVALPGGSRVYSAEDSKKAAGGDTYNITVNTAATSGTYLADIMMAKAMAGA